jgi:hypothetical protein
MNDGSVRAILKLEPINFDLKSENEQNGIIYNYQSFLNSLDFPIQIVVQSKKLDLERYLMKVKAVERNQSNDLLRIQVEDYIGFVRRLISIANIMSKRFYIVVSYAGFTKPTAKNPLGGLFHRRPSGPIMDQEQFSRYSSETMNRAGIIAGGLERLGIKCKALSTQELIELFYGIYNPDLATEERLTDIDTLSSGVVHAPDALPASQDPELVAAAEAVLQQEPAAQETPAPEQTQS